MLENPQLPGSTINHFVALHPRAFQFPKTRGLFRPSCPNILLRQACCPLPKHTAGPSPEGRQPAHVLSMEKATCSCSTCSPHISTGFRFNFFFSFLATWQMISQFPKQESNPCPSLEAQSLNHWTTRGVPSQDQISLLTEAMLTRSPLRLLEPSGAPTSPNTLPTRCFYISVNVRFLFPSTPYSFIFCFSLTKIAYHKIRQSIYTC